LKCLTLVTITGQTAAEIITQRADNSKENMGLTEIDHQGIFPVFDTELPAIRGKQQLVACSVSLK